MILTSLENSLKYEFLVVNVEVTHRLEKLTSGYEKRLK